MIVIIFNSILLGLGLAMDAFSVSVVWGLGEINMKNSKMTLISGTFAVFQFVMPVVGYFAVVSLVGAFENFIKYVPFIAFVLLFYLGGKMIFEAIKAREIPEEYAEEEEDPDNGFSFGKLVALGFTTSIDALSAGFTMTGYSVVTAIISALIIGAVTFFVCFAGVILGKKVGKRISKKAEILGGCILVAIGIRSLVSGIFGLA